MANIRISAHHPIIRVSRHLHSQLSPPVLTSTSQRISWTHPVNHGKSLSNLNPKRPLRHYNGYSYILSKDVSPPFISHQMTFPRELHSKIGIPPRRYFSCGKSSRITRGPHDKVEIYNENTTDYSAYYRSRVLTTDTEIVPPDLSETEVKSDLSSSLQSQNLLEDSQKCSESRRHDDHSHYEEPSGWLWGIPPESLRAEGAAALAAAEAAGQSTAHFPIYYMPDDSWEPIWMWGFFGSIAVAAVLYALKPDTSIQTWALEEARRRLEREGVLPDPYPERQTIEEPNELRKN